MVQVGGDTKREITDLDLIQNLSTGITSGGGLRANVTNPNNFDVLAGSGVLLILTIVFSSAAYLNIRRLPQK